MTPAERHCIAQKKYGQTAKGRAARKRYRASEKGRAEIKRYNSTESRAACLSRYRASPGGRITVHSNNRRAHRMLSNRLNMQVSRAA